MSDEPGTNGARISNLEIFNEVRKVGAAQASTDQTVQREVLPALRRVEEKLEMKADKTALAETIKQVSANRRETYAVIGGFLSTLAAAKGLGIL